MGAEEVFDQLLEVSMLFQADLDRSITALGLTVTQTHLLWEVHQNGATPQQRLAEAIGVSPRHVTGLVDALEHSGFVRRTPHPTDRRVVLVELTSTGTRTLTQMQEQRSRDAAVLVADLDPRKVTALQRSLDAVLVRLRSLVEDGAP